MSGRIVKASKDFHEKTAYLGEAYYGSHMDNELVTGLGGAIGSYFDKSNENRQIARELGGIELLIQNIRNNFHGQQLVFRVLGAWGRPNSPCAGGSDFWVARYRDLFPMFHVPPAVTRRTAALLERAVRPSVALRSAQTSLGGSTGGGGGEEKGIGWVSV